VTFFALGMAVGALLLLIAGISSILKGRVAVGLVLGVLALLIGGGAGTIAAYA
jgi:hypothetical protein